MSETSSAQQYHMYTVINPESSNDLTENIKNINIQQHNYFNASKEFQFSW
jgi:hypothetical protein